MLRSYVNKSTDFRCTECLSVSYSCCRLQVAVFRNSDIVVLYFMQIKTCLWVKLQYLFVTFACIYYKVHLLAISCIRAAI